MTCPKASAHADHDHIELGKGEWAHFRQKLNNGQRQKLSVAELAADYQTAGTADGCYWMIHTTLSGAPEQWRNGYTDADGSVHEPQLELTMALVRAFLNEYETKHETVLLGPETRQKMAKATVDYYAAAADVFCVEGSWGEGRPDDGMLAELIEQRALKHWLEWKREMVARLKAVGPASA